MLIYRLYQYCGDSSEDYFYGYFKTKEAMLTKVRKVAEKELIGAYYKTSIDNIIERDEAFYVTYKTTHNTLHTDEPYIYDIIDTDELE